MKAPRIRTLVLLLAATVVIAGCGGPTGGSPPNTDGGAVPKGTYVVVGMTEAGKARPVVAGTQIRFTFEARQLLITAGCNTMSGPFRLDRGRLSVGALASTAMGCPAGPAAQDAWLAGLFAGPVQLTFDAHGAVTRLTSGTTVLTVADRRTVSPDRPLIGTRWLLNSITRAGTTSSVPSGIPAYVHILDSPVGLIQVFDGCRTGISSVRVQPTRLSFGPRAQSKIACPAPEAQEVQQAFAAVLVGTATYQIQEDALTITRGDLSMGFTAAPVGTGTG